MNRREFIRFMAMATTSLSMQGKEIIDGLKAGAITPKMPILFIGHGSPMNAIEENEFVQGFKKVAAKLPKPEAILCISAHWETRGTYVTAMEQPRTIHDFGGFPQELFEVQYPAPGSRTLARSVQEEVKVTTVQTDKNWGLDHGTWSVLRHFYPKADIPVVQLSLDYTKPATWHYQLARELKQLRERGVLIVGSGNMVHNLRRVAWNKLNEVGFAFDWAAEAREIFLKSINTQNHTALVNYQNLGKAVEMAIPTPEHYLPLLYILALQEKDEQPVYFNDKAVAGALTMTSVQFG